MRTLRIVLLLYVAALFGFSLPAVACNCSACIAVANGQSTLSVPGCVCSTCISLRQVVNGAPNAVSQPHVVSPPVTSVVISQSPVPGCACRACVMISQGHPCAPVKGCTCAYCSSASTQHQAVTPAPQNYPVQSYPSSEGEEGAVEFGWISNWDIRVNSLVNEVSNVPPALRSPNGILVEPDSVDVGPNLSVLTRGVGLKSGNPDSGQWRIGVRPEFVLSPHNVDDSNFWNWGGYGVNKRPIGGDDEAFWGVQINDWIVPEYLLEYQKRPWTFGLSYKVYHLGLHNGIIDGDEKHTFQNLEISDLETLSLYFKYKHLSLGYSFLNSLGNNGGGINIHEGFPIILGYAF